jgi:hypothetical protein
MSDKIIDRDLDKIEKKTPKPAFDAKAYEGKRVRIASVTEKEVIDFYTGENGTYNEKSTAKKHEIQIETEPLPKLDEAGNFTTELYSYFDELEGKEKNITVIAKLGLKFDKETKDWIISKHPKANLWKFMRKMGVDKLSELKNKYVTLTAKPSTNPEDDRSFLVIVL